MLPSGKLVGVVRSSREPALELRLRHGPRHKRARSLEPDVNYEVNLVVLLQTTTMSQLNPRKRPADTQEEAWVKGEDRFVLQQAKKKAEIRVKGGRARPIDWLAVTLRFVDPTREPLDDEIEDHELEVVNPESVFESLADAQLADLEKDIDTYIALERNRTNLAYWEVSRARFVYLCVANGHPRL